MFISNEESDKHNSVVPASLRNPVRLRTATICFMLTTFFAALIPALATAHLQALLLASVLAGAGCFGLSVGLASATVGFALLLWREFETKGTLTLASVIEAVVWFAVAKFAAALVAQQRRQYIRQRAARQEAEAAARQQKLLLREMTHRTRNDMQRLIGMLNTQANTNPAASDALHQAARRVLVQTRLNERLSMRGAETLVESRAFLEELGNDLRNTIELGQSVGLSISSESHLLAATTAADIGLIVNELVTNALKHGFPGSAAGIIRVTFHRVGENGDLYELLVTDNGIGAASANPTSGSGQNLLRALASQLGGRIIVSRGEVGGTQCRLLFPVKSVGSADVSLWPSEDAPAQVQPADGVARAASRGLPS